MPQPPLCLGTENCWDTHSAIFNCILIIHIWLLHQHILVIMLYLTGLQFNCGIIVLEQSRMTIRTFYLWIDETFKIKCEIEYILCNKYTT